MTNKKLIRSKAVTVLSAAIILLFLCIACTACTNVNNGNNKESDGNKNNGKLNYSIVRINGEPAWDSVPTLSLDNILWEPDCGIRANAQICYDDDLLYVHLKAKEENIRAEYDTPLSPVYEDSCLEFFFMPEGENRYFNFEINPNGCLGLEFGYDRKDRAALYKEEYKEYFNIKTDRTSDGWEVYYSIPVEFIRIYYPEFSYSGNLLANVYKCGNKTEHKHYLSWNPVTSEKPDFHRVEDFGRMTFSK